MSTFLRRIVAKRILHILNKNNKVANTESAERLLDIINLKAVTKKSNVSDCQFVFGGLSKLQRRDDNEQKLFELIKQFKIQNGGDEQHLRLEPELVAKEVINFIRHCDGCYGYTDIDGQVCKHGTVVVEFSSPNIAKPFHAGHLRSTVIGNYIANLYERLGYHVIRLNYLGDWGTQFGLLAVGYEQFGDPVKLEENPMQHLFEVYVKVNQKVLEEKTKNENVTFAAGLEAFRKMENGDEDLLALWNKFRELSIQEYSKTYAGLYRKTNCVINWMVGVAESLISLHEEKFVAVLPNELTIKALRLGVHFTEYHSESMYHSKSLEIIENLRKLSLLQVDNVGKSYVEVDAVTDDNKKAVLLKSDGATLYLTRDVAALLDRYDRYKFDRIHYVVQDAQFSHFRQLIGIVKKIVDWSHKFTDNVHIRFGRVEGMSTRKGEVVFLKDILDEAQHRVLDTMKQKDTTKVTKDMSEIADTLGAGAIIVQDLTAQRLKNYKFSWERVLSMKADSGISLQYTHARLCKVLGDPQVFFRESQTAFWESETLNPASGKTLGISLQYAHARLCNLEENCGVQLEDMFDPSFLINKEAQLLLLHLARYEDVIQKSLSSLEPHHTVQYLFQLCHFVNAAYKNMTVKNEPPDKAQAHLQLFHVSRITLANGMTLLGLKPLHKM